MRRGEVRCVIDGSNCVELEELRQPTVIRNRYAGCSHANGHDRGSRTPRQRTIACKLRCNCSRIECIVASVFGGVGGKSSDEWIVAVVKIALTWRNSCAKRNDADVTADSLQRAQAPARTRSGCSCLA